MRGILILALWWLVVGANDAPAATIVVPRDQVGQLRGGVQEVYNYVTNVKAGSSATDDGDILCGGNNCACTVSNAALFSSLPVIDLLTYTPTFLTPTTGTLKYSLAVPFTGFPVTSTVSCTIPDNNGNSFTVPTFSITANGLTWSPTVMGIACSEDTLCSVSPLFSNLNDNNGGTLQLPLPCPPGGSSTCFYEITSTDIRWNNGFFRSAPSLSDTPATGCVSCKSDLSIQLADDVNTVGTWGATGPLMFTVLIRDANGNAASPVTFSLTVAAVPDPPSADLNTSLEVRYGAASYTFPNVLTNLQTGPSTALDETGETFPVMQTCTGNASLFTGTPSIQLAGGNGTLSFTLQPGLTGYPTWADFPGPAPITTALQCTLADSGGASTMLPDIIITIYPPNTPPSVVCGTCDATVAEGMTASFSNFFIVAGSSPAGLAWELTDTVRLQGCVITSDTCVSTTGSCITSVTVTGAKLDTLEAVLVLDAVGRTNFTCTFQDSAGGSIDVEASLLVTEVNDNPTAVLKGALALSTFYSNINTVEVPDYVVNVRPGAVGSVSEDAQVLCGGGSCACVASDAALFLTMPFLRLNMTPTAAAPASASLVYALAPGLSSVERSSTVTCTITDDAGGSLTLQPFTILATTKPSWRPSVNTISCYEDGTTSPSTTVSGWCVVPNFLTALNDNNNGSSIFSVVSCPLPCSPSVDPCPPSPTGGGGGASTASQCWYSARSADTRYNTVSFLQVKPYFSAAPSNCSDTSLCSSDLVIQTGVDANTGGGTMPLTITVQDIVGNEVAWDVSLEVLPVNDNPTIEQVSASATIQATSAVQVLPYVKVRPGPITATDEDGQVVIGSCTASNPSVFASGPTLIFDSATPTAATPATADMQFTLTTLTTFPVSVTVVCTVTDNQGGSTATPQFTLTVNEGPPTWVPSSLSLSCDEDNSAAPSTTASPCVFGNFVSSLNDNKGGVSTFTPSPCPSVSCWYTLTSSDARWGTMFAVDPVLSLPSPTPCVACRSDLTLVLKDNFNTGGTPVPFDVLVKDNTGRTAPVVSVMLTVPAVNDLPTAAGGGDVSVVFSSSPITISNFITSIAPGPSTAVDELSETVSTNCTVTSPALFSTQPDLSKNGDTADLVFQIASTVTFPARTTATCVLKDSMGSQRSMQFTIAITAGPPQWNPSSFTLTGYEDNSVTPTPVAGLPFVFPNFVMNLDDNGNGVANFDSGACPLSPCWYTITTTNDAFFSVPPSLSSPTCSSAKCSADLTFNTAANNYGKVNMSVVVRNTAGFTAETKLIEVTVLSVNDVPTAVLTKTPNQNVMWNDTTIKVANFFLTNITAGPNEPGQVATVSCSNSNSVMFSVQPKLSITGMYADLSYALAGSMQAATTTVSCVLSDGNAQTTIAPFSIKAAVIPTWTLLTTTTTCFEDGVATAAPSALLACYHADFITALADNNNGQSGFAEAGCPTSCWYSISSDDPRWDTMFKTPPTLTIPQVPCTGGCTSDLRYTLADNVNTADGNVRFSVIVTDSSGRVAETKYGLLNIAPVNDMPTADYPPVVAPNGVTTSNFVPDLFTNIVPGPADEAAQSVTGVCEGTPTSVFASAPVMTIKGTTADLSFVLRKARPSEEGIINCTLTDTGVPAESNRLQPIRVTTLLSWVSNDIACIEDGSSLPRTTAVECEIKGFVSSLDDNNNGMSVFTGAWYEFSSTDTRWPTVFSRAPMLTPVQYCTGTCTSHLTLTLRDNVNTADGPIPLNFTIRDTTGRAATMVLSLSIPRVNDYPTWGTVPKEVITRYNNTAPQSFLLVSDVRTGFATSDDEDGQVLCRGAPCKCSASPDIFFSAPVIAMTTYSPKASTGTTGTLLFTIRPGLTGMERSRVTCDIDDGSLVQVVSFTITAEDPSDALCPPYIFPDGVEGGSSDSCLNGSSLSTIADPSCNVRCVSGYNGGGAIITCPFTAVPSCPPNRCSNGPVSAASADYSSCNAQFTGGYCNPQCRAGYHRENDGFELTCSNARTYVDPNAATTCVEDKCLVSLSTGTTPGGADPCKNGMYLGVLTDTSCTVQCATGYFDSNSTNMVTCPSGAQHGSLALVSASCVRSCSTYTCTSGVLKPNPESVPCPNSSCNFNACCNSFCSTFTGCSTGYILKSSPESINCNSATCTRDICCDVSCDLPTFTECSTAGYIARQPASSIKCPDSGCDSDTCCFATCDNEEFTGCQHGHYSLRPNSAFITCSGGNAGRDCDIPTCCTQTCYINTFTCKVGLVKKLNPASIQCDDSGCGEERCCDAICDANEFSCRSPSVLKGTPAAPQRCLSNSPSSCTQFTCCTNPCDGVVCFAINECHEAGTCSLGKCSNIALPDSTLCSSGTCRSGSCVEDVSCAGTPCYVDACTTATCKGNTCFPVVRGNGLGCNDNSALTRSDQCINGVCTGIPLCNRVICHQSSQCHEQGVCDPITGTCSSPLKPDATLCDDGEDMTADDRCVSGVCVGRWKCAGILCPYRECHIKGSCNITTELCEYERVPDLTRCRTTQTTTSYCLSGVCVDVDCGCVAAGPCRISTCQNGGCIETNTPDGGSCMINGTEDGRCSAGVCAPVDKCLLVACPVHTVQCYGQSFCNNATGQCTDPAALPDYTSCDDGLDTTVNSVCLAGVCKGTPKCEGVVCPTLQCKNRGICNDKTGLCEYGNSFNGVACSDGIVSTEDTCLDGTCSGRLVCSRTTCTAGECMYPTCVNEQCSEAPAADGTTCNGGKGSCFIGTCVQQDLCSGVQCTPANQCKEYIPCWNGRCADVNKPDLTPCDDGNSNTVGDVCKAGVCVGSEGCACGINECLIVTACTVSSCNYHPAPTGTACTSGLCDSGVCVPSLTCGVTKCTPRPCYSSFCNGTVCIDYALADGTLCDDGNIETMDDACYLQKNKGSACIGVDKCKGVTCTPFSQCHMRGACNALTGICSNPVRSEGASCDDSNSQTTLDRCVQGTCVGTQKCSSCPSVPCAAVGSCNPLTGTCSTVPHPDGAACDDNNAATINDVCRRGSCVGVVPCGNLVCTTSRQCFTPVCLQGVCSEVQMPDGTLCSILGNFTDSPTCRNGQCIGPATCSPQSCPAPGVCYEMNTECVVTNGIPKCTTPTVPNYTPCDDRDVTSYDDVCINGACIGTALCASKWCPYAGQCYEQTLCNRSTGACVPVPVADGTFCSDDDPFTTDDRCYAGSCLGVVSCVNATIPCRPASQCHAATCINGATCVQTVLIDAPCDDGNSGTIDDKCTSSGVCQGSDICGAQQCLPTQCQNRSWCNKENGTCMSTPAVDGTPCDDGLVQTTDDRCVAGFCIGRTKCDSVTCMASDSCHNPGVCDDDTGLCNNPNKPDSTTCDDGFSLTVMDRCSSGACVGTDACQSVVCKPYGECFSTGECVRGVCTNPLKDNNAPCNNGTGTCQAGKCIASNPCDGVVCQPSDQCHAVGVCNTTSGFCSDPPLPDGSVCSDGYQETSNDQCLNGMCKGSVVCGGQSCISTDACQVAFCSGTACTQLPLDNEPCNDNNPVTAGDRCKAGVCVGAGNCDGVICATSDPCLEGGVCNPLNGKCSWQMVKDGSQCDDKNSSTVNDQCHVGVCKGEPTCSRPCVASGECQVNGLCDLQTGVCPELPLPDNSPCNDNDPNTQDEVCINGVCTGSITCDGMARCVTSSSCKKPACNNNICTEVDLPDGAPCTDFNSQTKEDKCVKGVCVGIVRCTSICAQLSQCHDVGVCEPTTGLCSTPVSAANTPCDDGDSATFQDSCQSGVCVGQPRCSTPCLPSDQCHVAGVCNGTTGLCTDPIVPDNTPCDDGNPSTLNDICINGMCVGGLPCGTTSCYSTNQCATPQCDRGACAVLPKTVNSKCNDGNLTTFNDVCVGSTCQGTSRCTGRICDLVECFVARCEPATGTCTYDQAPQNTPCNDGNALTFDDTCTSGVCMGRSLCANVTCAALSSCHAVGVCDPALGVCTNPLRPDNATCDDGNILTSNDKCTNGLCSGFVMCGGAACYSTACEIPTCSDNKTCTYAYKPDGIACDNRNFTYAGVCQSGMCIERGPCWGVSCPAASTCHMEGVCNPRDGTCSEVFKQDNTLCDDKDANTRGDVCVGGVCVGMRNCEGTGCVARLPCRRDGVCDPTDGLCTEPTLSDGTVCDDSNILTLDDRCVSGICIGVITCGSTTCASTDQCMVSYCNTNGVCAETLKADGTPCSDNNPKTLIDQCIQGVCTPIDLCKGVQCQGNAKCIGPGICDPHTGKCSTNFLPDNTICNDDNENTVGDRCKFGVCSGVDKCSQVNCASVTQCSRGTGCDKTTGLCTIDTFADGTLCSDGDITTNNDVCIRGSCLGGKRCGLSTLCIPRGQCYRMGCKGDACFEEVMLDGTLCNDNNPNTVNDMCTGGVCTGRDPCDGITCLSADACQLDGVCLMGKCYHRLQPDGTTCDDGIPQTSTDRCVAGVCVGYVECGGMVCIPRYPQCQYAACNGTQCTDLTKPDGTGCNDGMGGTDNDKCLSGLCMDNSPCRGIVCKPISQCHGPGVCDNDIFQQTGTCSAPLKVGAVPCDDGDQTTAVAVCDNGVCKGTPKCDGVRCQPSDQCHNLGMCDPLTGLCTDPPKNNGDNCNDGNAQSSGDQCFSGICVGTVQCGSPSVQCPRPLEPCLQAACDNGNCVVLKMDSVPCNDNDTTTSNDVCVDGLCVGVDVCTGVVCPQSTECIASQCIYGKCNTVMKPNNTLCNDGNQQTINDRCVNGMCFGDNPCELGQCSSSCDGVADGTPCDDGMTLSIDDRCVRGVCTGTYRCLSVTCTAMDDCHTPGTCNPFTGVCTDPLLPDDTPCNDGDIVTLEDKCLNGVCVGRVKCGNTFCGVSGQCVMAYCIGDTCAQRSKFDMTPCDDGKTNTSLDSCLGGQCVGRDFCINIVCSPSDNCHEAGVCDKQTGRCSDPMKPDATYCTSPQVGTCAAGNCVPAGVPCDLVVCSTTSPCHVPRCDSGNKCVLDKRPNHSPCNDNNADTVKDYCFDGVCVGVDLCTGIVCQDDACHGTGTCDPLTGICSQPLRAEGVRCNDGDIDTVDDLCVGGGCVGIALCGGVRCLPSQSQCRVAVCNGLSCDERNALDGSPCSDLNDVTVDDTCRNGTCVGTFRCANVVCQQTNSCVGTMTCSPRSGKCEGYPLQDGTMCTTPDGSTGVCSSGTCNVGAPCGQTICYSANPQCYYATCKDGKCLDAQKYNGALCNDDNLDTMNDKCLAGVCSGELPCSGVTCTLIGQCHASNTCNKHTGKCELVFKEATETCDDGNIGTSDDRCIVGVCRGTAMCNGLSCRATDPQCQIALCIANKCVQQPKPVGTLCDDYNSNTTNDKCQPDGTCQGRNKCEGITCTSSRACHRPGVCDPLTGLCSEVLDADGTACFGGTCRSGGCVANITCTLNEPCMPLEPQCTFAKCNGLICIRGYKKPNGSPCNDADPETFDDICTDGKCAGVSKCAGVVCKSSDVCRMDGVCDPATGLCSEPYVSDGSTCNDTNINTVNDVCVAGMCRGEVICGSTTCTLSGPCKTSTCTNGACGERDRYDGSPCNDHNVETFDDQCMSGSCVGVDKCASVQCQPPGFQGAPCYGTGVCNPRTGLCEYPVLEDDRTCGNGGSCKAGTCVFPLNCGSRQCPDNTQCTLPSCVNVTQCTTIAVADGTPCNDNDNTTRDDVCTTGACTGVNACQGVVCTALDQCHAVGVCDYKTGRCSNPKKPEATPCDDSNDATVMDSCMAGSCVGVTMCGGQQCLPTRSTCRTVSCEGGQCREQLLDNVPCNDENALTTNDRCYSGFCSGLNLCDGVSCSAKSDCYLAGQCNLETGTCSNPIKPYADTCDDSFPNTANDTCNLGACSGVIQCNGAPCSTPDPCKISLCNATTCVVTNKLNGSSCDDFNDKTLNDVCGNGVCQGVDRCASVVCVPLSECHFVGVCGRTTGRCTDPLKTNGSSCSGGECILGTCNSIVTCFGRKCTVDDPRCKVPTCNTQGFCETTNRPDGTTCDDLDGATVKDSCSQGICRGVPQCETSACPELECKTSIGCDALNRCLYEDLPDNNVCDDGEDTTTDRCLGGQCVGIADCGTYKCMAPNQCSVAVCITNKCTVLIKDDGAYCDDGNPSTIDDQCVAGACVGKDKCNGVVCGTSDDCHVQGVCNTLTGQCRDPRANDGIPCNDGQVQSIDDTCTAGVCYGMVSCGDINCNPPKTPCIQVTCNGGSCVEVNKPNGTVCNDEEVATVQDQCRGGVCAGVKATCANGVLRPDASPAVCAIKPNANETECPFGVCDGNTCCDTCLNVDAELCTCKMLVINARAKRCPPGGCTIDQCCSAGVHIALVKFTSSKLFASLVLLDRALVRSLSTLLNIEESMVMGLRIFDLGSGKSGVDVSVSNRPTTTAPNIASYAASVQTKLSDDILNGPVLQPYEFLTVRATPSTQPVGTVLVVLNVTLQISSQRLSNDNELFLNALSKATSVPRSMLSHPRIISSSPTITTARVIAKPCGIDTTETSKFILGELEQDKRKNSNGALTKAGFPLLSYSVSDTVSSAVQGTLSLLLSISIPPDDLQGHLTTYVGDTGGIIDSSCVESLTFQEANTYRMEALISDISGNWDAREWSDLLRKAVTNKKSVVSGIQIKQAQAEPTRGDCSKRPCGCGQRCIDEDVVDNVFMCRCRYPYNSGNSQSKAAFCVENELTVLSRNVQNQAQNKVQVANNLLETVKAISRDELLWGDGRWVKDATNIVKDLSTASANPEIEHALLKTLDLLVIQAGSLWSECCRKERLDRFPGHCCGDITDHNNLRVVSNEVGDALGSIMNRSTLVNEPVICPTKECIGDQDDITEKRGQDAQIAKHYLVILHDIGEQVCKSELGNILVTNDHGSPYIKQSTTFGIHSVLLNGKKQTAYFPIDFAKFKVVFEGKIRSVHICRTVIEIANLLPYKGRGYPASTPISAVLSVRYLPVGVDPRPDVEYAFTMSRPRSDQSANDHQVVEWDMATTDWKLVKNGVNQVTTTSLVGKYSGTVSGTATTSRAGQVLVSTSEDILVTGMTERDYPNNSCFACRSLPVVWGAAMVLVLVTVMTRLLAGHFIMSPASSDISLPKEFLLTHYWTRIAFRKLPGFHYTKIHKAVVMAIFIIDGWGTITLFYPNSSNNYEWEVDMGTWPVYGMLIGLLGSLIPPTFDFVALQPGEVFEKKPASDLFEKPDPEEPVGEVTVGSKIWRVFYFTLPFAASVAMFLGTSEYNTDKQEERYIKTFLAGFVFNVLIFEPIRVVSRMCSRRRYQKKSDEDADAKSLDSGVGREVEMHEDVDFSSDDDVNDQRRASVPVVLSSYRNASFDNNQLLSPTQRSINGRATSQPPMTRGRGRGVQPLSRAQNHQIRTGPAHPIDPNEALSDNPLTLFSQYSKDDDYHSIGV